MTWGILGISIFEWLRLPVPAELAPALADLGFNFCLGFSVANFDPSFPFEVALSFGRSRLCSLMLFAFKGEPRHCLEVLRLGWNSSLVIFG